MRNVFENPFINAECARLGLEKAPIPTNIYETYAQCNEDLIAEAILRALILRAGRAMNSVRYIEIGANHPIQTNSTYLLNRVYGATGVLVEANPRLIPALKSARPNDLVLNRAITAAPIDRVELFVHEKNELTSMSQDHIDRFQVFGGSAKIVETISVEAMQINAFMKQYHQGRLDFLSVDVEGFDLSLIEATDAVFMPAVVQLEHEQKFDQFEAVMGGKGYRLAGITDVNLIYVKAGLA